MLELRDVHSFYGRSHVIQGISLQVGRGEGVGLVGHNGVGKTTTLKSIMGLGPRTRGQIVFDDRELHACRDDPDASANTWHSGNPALRSAGA